MRNFLVKNNFEIGVLGLWHLGSVYSTCLAKLGFTITGFDEDKTIINNLQRNRPPIEEPFLLETIKQYSGKTLNFTADPKDAISNKKYLFVTYDVPVNDNDQIETGVIDRTFSLIAGHISPNTTVVISSQIPIGTSRKLLKLLQKKEPSTNIIYFPENLRLGNAFESFLKPERIVIGSNKTDISDQFEKDFSVLFCPVIKISLESAEMVKHALNSYLAMMISFSSEFSDLSEILGANMNEVVLALKSEKRISKFAPINPGLGFSGGTLGRDIQTLRSLGKKNNYSTTLLNSIYQVNKERLPHLLERIKTLLPSLRNKTVGILGLTYKPKTNTLRRSMSLELANLLHKEGARIKAYDPMVKDKISNMQFIKVVGKKEFFKDLDFVILMTEWEDFGNIDWKKESRSIKSGIVFDSKNFLDKDMIEKASLKYVGIGVPK